MSTCARPAAADVGWCPELLQQSLPVVGDELLASRWRLRRSCSAQRCPVSKGIYLAEDMSGSHRRYEDAEDAGENPARLFFFFFFLLNCVNPRRRFGARKLLKLRCDAHRVGGRMS